MAPNAKVGPAAWMLGHPGFGNWTYGADPEQLPTRDDVLDNITLYWFTKTGASAARIYWENGGRGPTSAADQKSAEISLPVAITVFPDEVYRSPETWARRAYRNLIYFNEADKGEHFAAWEQPQVFSEERRAAFRSLRSNQANTASAPGASRQIMGTDPVFGLCGIGIQYLGIDQYLSPIF